MTKDQLAKFHDRQNAEAVTFPGTCHDCGKSVCVRSTEQYSDDEQLHVTGYKIAGGAIYLVDECNERFAFKCAGCAAKEPVLKRYQETEVYSRVVGYMRPVSQWGKGKAAEFQDRKTFDRTFRLPDEAA